MVNHTTDQIRQLLLSACKLAGSQKDWAERNSVSSSYVTDVLLGRREPGASILKVLGYERLTVYRKHESGAASRAAGDAHRVNGPKCVISKREMNLAKNRIRGAVRLAMAGKVLTQRNCDSCHLSSATTVAHHDDYNRPLDIRWMCNRCHRKWHGVYLAVDPDPKMLALSNYECLVLGLEQHPEIKYPASLVHRNPKMQRKRKQEDV